MPGATKTSAELQQVIIYTYTDLDNLVFQTELHLNKISGFKFY